MSIGDALGTAFVYLATAVILFGLPLYTLSANNDDMAQTALQAETDDFADNVEKTGILTADDYASFEQTVSADGTAKEIELQIGRIDENPGKKTTQANSKKQGENAMYYIFTNEIENTLKENGAIVFNQGDTFSVSTRNKTQTLNNMLTNIFYSVPPSATYTLASQASVTCTVNGDLSS